MGLFLAGAAAGAVFAFLLAAFGFGRRARFLGRFFSFAAHEINTPITAVNMTILNLLGGVFGPLPAEQVQWVEMMREQISRLSGMVGELRDLIHLELHRDLVMQREDVDPAELVETAARAVEVGCASAGIPLERSVEPGLPKASCDPDRAPRTLASMLFHARKFRTGGPVRLQASLSGRLVRLSVEYEAAKLTAEDAARSLELFYPAHMRGQSLSATGLGLGILRAVAREQGGDFDLSVRDGKARLSLLLPAAITP
jgi:signal transduction histidine kinase